MGILSKIFAKSIFVKKKMTLTQWSENHRVLSRESSAQYGKFKAFAYQKEPMDEISNTRRSKVVLLFASQLGKSEMINNAIGYFIHQEPSTILFMLPNENDAEDYSKRRLTPMIRDCEVLKELINANDANNTILIKNFSGGNLALVGSNSVSKLASKPIKILLIDEADRCENTKEGSAIKLAEKRTVTFSQRKIVISSTPTLKDSSQILSEFELSDKRYFFIKCPHCGYSQTLDFSHVVWEKDKDNKPIFESVRYTCADCGALLSESEKNRAVASGEWIATNPGAKTAGFFLNAFYSPFFSMQDIVRDWYESKDDQSKLQTFINTIEARGFEPPTISLNSDELFDRIEPYDSQNVPECVKFITAGIDIQANRIEINFIGWASGFEAFNIEYKQIHGNTDQEEVWGEAFKYLHKKFTLSNGKELTLTLGLVDSGFNTERVYKFCAASKRLLATKGANEGTNREDFINPIKKIKNGCYFMRVGTYKGKSELMRLLKIKEAGNGYFHYGKGYTREFFAQLNAEKLQKLKNKNGYEKLQWVKIRERNEALDISVLALAGAKIVTKRVKF
ncbi:MULTISPECIES: phage terminase large subunit family protein [unclassified Campylobacter]|uniref:phage terminase large subunit family protein n=1 Tax=unclassified Campylobacter TaxID=2593542 RepID=UPI003D340B7F